ncbi:response regulator transcription factor [Pseudoxanthomonas sp. UTMC 1351]|uniref:response regulator transcription factor n=1 Tax=Pseudoxanthomonas sp. UTMC 1351 TaxID=2695853 RepID=UPI0034CDC8F8
MRCAPALQIAILDDDEVLREQVLLPKLTDFGFDVAGLATTFDLHRHLKKRQPDMLVLNVELPDGSGFELAKRLRRERPQMGLIMLTGQPECADEVRALISGADACVSKPIRMALLAATLHSVARRLRSSEAYAAPESRWHLRSDGWCLASPAGRSIGLTRSERRLVQRLVSSEGSVVSRTKLVEELTDDIFDYDMHRLDSIVHRLRRKVMRACAVELPLSSVRGEGYCWTA